MDDTTRAHWNNLRSDDGDVRYAAFMALLAITDQPVDWAYEVWNELLANLRHKDNHQRAIAAQLLSNLAKSDPEQRMLKDFDALFAVTRDERFVTARHSMRRLLMIG
jgi:HEAT repeat protein